MYDEDLTSADTIGVATLTYADLVDARIEQESYWIRVDNQTNNQLLAIQVHVVGVL